MAIKGILILLSSPSSSLPPGIPFFLFLVLLPLSIPWGEVDSVWICVVHYLACLSPTVGSVLYHLFMNHVGGEGVYDNLLSLDMFGVCLVNTLGRSVVRRGTGGGVTVMDYTLMEEDIFVRV